MAGESVHGEEKMSFVGTLGVTSFGASVGKGGGDIGCTMVNRRESMV